ncbi:MAG: transposase, partial [Alphaproteobacteria bacterium]|nr:transposase [Alphaproteobacteria bacterium]
MSKTPKLPDITEEQKNPLVTQLIEVIHYQMEVIQALRDEIAVLKGNKPKPKIRPGKMEKESNDNKDKKSSEGKRPGSIKKSKTKELVIHETIPIPAEN